MDNGSELDEFCGDTFWNTSLTWTTDNPDLTLCFQRTVLLWVPCAVLWVFAALEAFYLINSKNRNVPWNWLNLTKLFVTFLLTVVCLSDLGYAVSRASEEDGVIFNVHYYTPFILIASFCLSGVFVVYNKIRGMTASGLLFFFWGILAVCGIVQLRSEIMRATNEDEYSSSYFFISYIIYYALVLVQFLLHCFADKPPIFSEFPPAKNPCPELRSSSLSRFTFAWFDKMAWKGFRKPLEPSDLWAMNPEETSGGIVPTFEKHWAKAVRDSTKKSSGGAATFQKQASSVDIVGRTPEKKYQASILWPLCKAFGPTFLFGAFLKFLNDLLLFVNPHILELLIGFIQNDDEVWKGYLYAVLLLIVASTQTMALSQYFYKMMIVGLRSRTALISAIYRKSLRMSVSAKKETTVGEIVNLMSVDAQRFMELTTYLNMIWSAPLQIGLSLYFLWGLLGPSVLAGLAVMIILIPVNGFIANKAKTLQIKQMKYKDQRVKVMNEVLSGIKVLKLYAWEPSFESQILNIRSKEIKVLKQAAYLSAGTSFIWSCAPFLVSLVSLATFVLVSSDNQVDASVAFVSLNYFNLMRFPMSMLPNLIPLMIQVSLAAFTSFVLLGNELTYTSAFVSLSYFNAMRHPMVVIPMFIAGLIQVSLAAFMTYVLLGNDLTYTSAFVSLSYFYTIRFPLSHIPMIIAGLVQVSLISFTSYVLLGYKLTVVTAFVSLSYFSLISFPLAALPFLIAAIAQMSLACIGAYVLVGNELTATSAFVSLAYFNAVKASANNLPRVITGVIQVALVSFATFVLSDENNVLDSRRAFVALSLFNILRFPLSMLPIMISSMVQTSVSVKRINKFLNGDEIDPNDITHDESEQHPLVVENGTFAWGPEEAPTLKGINLNIKQGQLIAVVGTVGSGKSSLLSALLGEMVRVSGRINTKGSVAYVPQQAWIQNATLRDNILFGKQLEHSVYNRVVDACALKPDLEMLPAADQTEIGEKGINLSGGQKQRVSLARAVYNNSDVYFLDDPLSAVDSHVGKHIFENVIGPSGILRKKTRLLVTHGITYLPEVDVIVVLKDGAISETGTYKELLERKGAFAEFLIAHLQESEDVSELDLEEIKTQLEGAIGEETFREIHRQRSETKSDSGSIGRKKSVSICSDGDGDGSPRKNSVSPTANGKAKPGKDKLIEVEKAETGSVKWAVYSHYLRSIGVFLTFSTLSMNMIYQGFSIGSNIWLSVWSDASANATNGTLDSSDRDMYLGVYGALGAGQVLVQLPASLFLYVGAVRAAQILHSEMLSNVLHSPNRFFDVTPLGRILSRFGKDIEVLDNTLPETFRMLIACFFSIAPRIGSINAAVALHAYMLRGIFHSPTCFFDITPIGRILVRFSKDIEIVDDKIGMLLADVYYFGLHISPGLGAVRAAGIIHAKMLKRVLRSPLRTFDTTPIGRILSRFSKDVDIVDNEIGVQLVDVQYSGLQVVATIVVISYTTPVFLAVILPIGVLYYLIQQFYVATSRQLKRIESVSRSPIYSHFGESVTGTQTIRAYGVQHRFIRESEEKVDFNQICYFPSMVANRWLAIRLEMIGNLIIFFAAIFAVLNRDTMNPGLVGLSVTYSLQITQTLNWLVRMTSDVETNIVAVERIKEYGETPQEAAWEIPDQKPPSEWPIKGEVEFRDYQVRYREGLDLVLKGVNFKVCGGEKVGIVGRTGAGKSSLTLALFRIIEPANGSIYIDGVDVTKIGLHDLRNRLTIIPQDPVLFSGTIRLNLDPFGLYSDQDVWKALEHAHLKQFVSQLALGLDHEVSEGGENLSVGQRQLICLARALLRKTKVLILDEATAAVDLETDDLIQRTIRSEFIGCTVLTIAHRLNTILDSDRVVVLDKGLIMEYDSPQTLLAKPKSLFAAMAKDAGITVDKKKE